MLCGAMQFSEQGCINYVGSICTYLVVGYINQYGIFVVVVRNNAERGDN